MTSSESALQKVPGFESTGYAMLNGELVWAGDANGVDHPRNLRHRWQAPRTACDAKRLACGARTGIGLIDALPGKGLLLWLRGRPLPFPLDPARNRFDAIRDALERNDLAAFAAAAPRVLGLGHGLTPSGDDFIGGICFALAHAPRRAWVAALPAVRACLLEDAGSATNVISAALLGDLMAGASYSPLHDLLAALQDGEQSAISTSMQCLLRVGATSGADMLAGLLLALSTNPDESPSALT